MKTPEYSGWYEVESDPPTFTMVVTRSQARFRRLTNGKKYTFKVTAVNQVGKSESEISKPCVPDDDITAQQYARKKKQIACQVKEILLKIRKEKKKQRAHDKLVKLQKDRTNQRQKDRKQDKATYNKIIAKQEKKKRQQARQRQKEEQARKQKKKKMDEQRKRVMENKRRMSFLAKERINNMNGKITSVRSGRNMNTASAMMGGSKKKKKGHKTTSNFGSISKSSRNKPKTNNNNMAKRATPLLDASEIEKLSKLREKDEARLSKKHNKKNGDKSLSPRKSKRKKPKADKTMD